jgi:O-antigen ligase
LAHAYGRSPGLLIYAAGNGTKAEALMNKKNLHGFLALMSLAMLIFVVIIHIRFVILSIFFLALGLLSYLWSSKKALVLFLFLLPLINSTPDIFFNGYPFNYMGVALFYLSGIMIASRSKNEKLEFIFPGYGLYLLFLVLISVSVFFVFLRWSNLTLSPLAFLHDTPVAPSGERLSFACIFPVITLALFSLTPFLASLIRHWHLKENEIFNPLKAGFCLSFLLALVQKWLNPDFLAQSWWRLQKNQVNGGFSDFNAFGFFAGAMFLYQALRLTEKLSGLKDNAVVYRFENSAGFPHSSKFATWGWEILFLMIALTAIFVSGCRTAFLFVLLAVIYLVFSRKTSFLAKALFVLLLAVSLLVTGGTLKKRLQQSVVQTINISGAADMFKAADALSSGRLTMLKDSAQMIGRFPVSGVGAGNFLFYLKYFHFKETAYLDLPLNQYLLIASETGLVGGLAFILFLAALLKRQKKGAMRFVTAAIVFALFFNFFFWLPECLLLFWVFLSASDWRGAPDRRLKPAWLWAIVVVFVAFNLLDFRALHPETLTRQKGVAYDYGFWPLEKNERGTFSWTRGAAGKYFTAAAARDFTLFCEAPYGWLQKEKMTVVLFWRGRFLQRMVFFENQFNKLQLPRGQEGFLEMRVHPTFNMKAMNLGADARELGVQFMELAKPLP